MQFLLRTPQIVNNYKFLKFEIWCLTRENASLPQNFEIFMPCWGKALYCVWKLGIWLVCVIVNVFAVCCYPKCLSILNSKSFLSLKIVYRSHNSQLSSVLSDVKRKILFLSSHKTSFSLYFCGHPFFQTIDWSSSSCYSQFYSKTTWSRSKLMLLWKNWTLSGIKKEFLANIWRWKFMEMKNVSEKRLDEKKISSQFSRRVNSTKCSCLLAKTTDNDVDDDDVKLIN